MKTPKRKSANQIAKFYMICVAMNTHSVYEAIKLAVLADRRQRRGKRK